MRSKAESPTRFILREDLIFSLQNKTGHAQLLNLILRKVCMRYFLFFFLVCGIHANAQCDSAAVHNWVRTINYDTIYTSALHGDTTSSIHFRNDSVFDYWYNDSVTGAFCYKHYENFYLEYYTWVQGETEINITYYDKSCVEKFRFTALGGNHFPLGPSDTSNYYYQEVMRTENGKLLRVKEETIVRRGGKRYRRVETKDYSGIFRKREVYYGEETSPGEFQ
jgi:hypothetical protein